MYKTGEPISAVMTIDMASRVVMKEGVEFTGLTEDELSKIISKIEANWNEQQDDLYTAMMLGLDDHPKSGNVIMLLAGQQAASMIMNKRKKSMGLDNIVEMMKNMSDEDMGKMIGEVIEDGLNKED